MKKNKTFLFGGPECKLCKGWQRKLAHLGVEHDYYDTSTVEGLAEMAFRNCARIPALIIGGQRFEEVNPAHLTSEQILDLAGQGAGRAAPEKD